MPSKTDKVWEDIKKKIESSAEFKAYVEQARAEYAKELEHFKSILTPEEFQEYQKELEERKSLARNEQLL